MWAKLLTKIIYIFYHKITQKFKKDRNIQKKLKKGSKIYKRNYIKTNEWNTSEKKNLRKSNIHKICKAKHINIYLILTVNIIDSNKHKK